MSTVTDAMARTTQLVQQGFVKMSESLRDMDATLQQMGITAKQIDGSLPTNPNGFFFTDANGKKHIKQVFLRATGTTISAAGLSSEVDQPKYALAEGLDLKGGALKEMPVFLNAMYHAMRQVTLLPLWLSRGNHADGWNAFVAKMPKTTAASDAAAFAAGFDAIAEEAAKLV